MQSQKAVTGHLQRKQLLAFNFAEHSSCSSSGSASGADIDRILARYLAAARLSMQPQTK